MDIYAYTYDTFVIFIENLNLLHIGNKDLIVKKIPFFETSNEEGGNTVYIGKEL